MIIDKHIIQPAHPYRIVLLSVDPFLLNNKITVGFIMFHIYFGKKQ